MVEVCKYCQGAEDKQDNPVLQCQECNNYVHRSCLRRFSTPGDLLGDVFFDYTCADCSVDGMECFVRNKMPWFNALILTFYQLNEKSYGLSNHGFFHWRTHISSFIDRNWNILFGKQIKQKKSWLGTISGILSNNNNLLFQSGSTVLGEAGWWKLMHRFSPTVAVHINFEMFRTKPRGIKKFNEGNENEHFKATVHSLGYGHLLNDTSSFSFINFAQSEEIPIKKVKIEQEETYYAGENSNRVVEVRERNSKVRTAEMETNESFNLHSFLLNKDDSVSDVDSFFPDFEENIELNQGIAFSDTSSQHSPQPSSVGNYESDSDARSPFCFNTNENVSEECYEGSKHWHHTENTNLTRKHHMSSDRTEEMILPPTLFTKISESSSRLPWLSENETEHSDRTTLVPLMEYEENQLLKDLDKLVWRAASVAQVKQLRRFRAKLAVRRLKRKRHLPLFDVDLVTKKLAGFKSENVHYDTEIADRVLDRFQAAHLLNSLCGTTETTAITGTRLVGVCEPATFQSPHSGRILKPYIRRDVESSPLWLTLMTQLKRKVNKCQDWVQSERSSIDYCYVRPQHIPAVNNLCAQFFWPGVDLTETLQYPEFSCVVLYKKLVIGFAFLVPDAGCNEAYLSFIFTRPEWRRAGIATFMLYHLLQTCSGKDVKLHVSATNPAVLLYQKFGFKVEELIQDFYDKYFEASSSECKHALVLRLSR